VSINDFAKKITQGEGLKKQVDIAQVKEILAVINRIIPFNLFYALIKLIPK
jgi:hypothetical protein